MKKNKEKKLLNFKKEKNLKVLNGTLIHLKSKDLIFLKSEWEKEEEKGESLIFLKEDIEKYKKEEDIIKIITPYILDKKENKEINRFSFKKINEYVFLYYTIK